jgi:DNA-binding SARP family transcriptional activator
MLLPVGSEEHVPARPAAAWRLRVGLLGPVQVNGQPGALMPARTQLLVGLALRGRAGLSSRQLCALLGTDAGHPRAPDSLRQLIARTRRQLGRAGDGREWIVHLGRGRYELHPDAWVDWHEFDSLTADDAGAADGRRLAIALSLVRGQPFSGCCYWWLETVLVERATLRIVAAAGALAQVSLASHDAAGAARAARTGLAADPAAEQLWRLLMRAEHAAGNLAGVHEAWARCVQAISGLAADGQPRAETKDVYYELLMR